MDTITAEELRSMLTRARSVEATFQVCLQWHGLAAFANRDYRSLLDQLMRGSERREAILEGMLDLVPSSNGKEIHPAIVAIELNSGDEDIVLAELLQTADKVLRGYAFLQEGLSDRYLGCIAPEDRKPFMDSFVELVEAGESQATAAKDKSGRIEGVA